MLGTGGGGFVGALNVGLDERNVIQIEKSGLDELYFDITNLCQAASNKDNTDNTSRNVSNRIGKVKSIQEDIMFCFVLSLKSLQVR